MSTVHRIPRGRSAVLPATAHPYLQPGLSEANDVGEQVELDVLGGNLPQVNTSKRSARTCAKRAGDRTPRSNPTKDQPPVADGRAQQRQQPAGAIARRALGFGP